MECPCCEKELECHDYYGLGIPGRSDFKKIGDIFKCDTEECLYYQEHFYTKENGDELFEGYPC